MPHRLSPFALVHRVIEAQGPMSSAVDHVEKLLWRQRVRPDVRLDDQPLPALVDTLSVSVVIPCFNYGRFLPVAVRSALGQTGVDVSVVVVDDCSTDDSAIVAEGLAAADERVSLIRLAENVGHVRAFNAGLEATHGELLVRLDADDVLAPQALARAAALFATNPDIGLVYGHARPFYSDVPRPNVTSSTWTLWSGHDWLAERCRRGVNAITTPEAVVRRSVADLIGPLDTRMRFAQDMEMWLRVAGVSDVARINGPDQALHREHPNSMSVTVGSGLLVDLEERLMAFRLALASADRLGGINDAAQLLAQVERTLADEAVRTARYAALRKQDDVDIESLLAFADGLFPGVATAQSSKLKRVGDRPAGVRLAEASRERLRSELDYLHWSRRGL